MLGPEQCFAAIEPSDQPFAMAMCSVPGIGSARSRRIQKGFGSFRAAWHATEQQLAAVGLSQSVVASFRQVRAMLEPRSLPEILDRYGIKAVFYGDEAYPESLTQVPDPPLVIYVRGALDRADRAACAIVGTRRATPYGRWMAQRLAAGLARAGIAVISGLAVGVDSAAHEAAVEAGGRTIAVLAGGLDVVYPVQGKRLAERILGSGGAWLSEYLPGTPTVAGNFLARNRLISGLALATVIVEAGGRSGALSTARHALEQGREVCAVPGRVGDPGSAGVHRLIRDGAHLTESAADVLQLIAPEAILALRSAGRPTDDAAAAENRHDRDERSLSHRLLHALANGPLSEAALLAKLGGGPAEIRAALTLLELDGQIKRLPGGIYLPLDSGPKVKQS